MKKVLLFATLVSFCGTQFAWDNPFKKSEPASVVVVEPEVIVSKPVKPTINSKLNGLKSLVSLDKIRTIIKDQAQDHSIRLAVIIALTAIAGKEVACYLYDKYVKEEETDEFTFS